MTLVAVWLSHLNNLIKHNFSWVTMNKLLHWMAGWLQVLYGVKPDEKKKFISRLQESQNVVAMVGDGINDAAALAASHVGIAIGGGVGAASEVSSIVLMQNRLSQVS